VKVKGLDGKTHVWSFYGKMPDISDERKRSELHLRARNILKELYPVDRILEEVYLPGSTGLYADFWLPLRNKIIEVHGEQHYKFIPFFHGTMLNFLSSKANDNKKRQWCELNGIVEVELPFNESDEQWKSRIESD
jgi:hypothetical protein